jgi:hypothetical protein
MTRIGNGVLGSAAAWKPANAVAASVRELTGLDEAAARTVLDAFGLDAEVAARLGGDADTGASARARTSQCSLIGARPAC